MYAWCTSTGHDHLNHTGPEKGRREAAPSFSHLLLVKVCTALKASGAQAQEMGLPARAAGQAWRSGPAQGQT